MAVVEANDESNYEITLSGFLLSGSLCDADEGLLDLRFQLRRIERIEFVDVLGVTRWVSEIPLPFQFKQLLLPPPVASLRSPQEIQTALRRALTFLNVHPKFHGEIIDRVLCYATERIGHGERVQLNVLAKLEVTITSRVLETEDFMDALDECMAEPDSIGDACREISSESDPGEQCGF